MKLHEHRFTVRGRGRFPTDMLRYDECFPASEADSARLDDRGPRFVELKARTGSPRFEPTYARWASFNWYATKDAQGV